MSMTQTKKHALTIYGGLNGVQDGDLFMAVADTEEGRPVLKLAALPKQKNQFLQEAIHHCVDAMQSAEPARYAHISQAFRALFATRTTAPARGFNPKPKKQASQPHWAEPQYDQEIDQV